MLLIIHIASFSVSILALFGSAVRIVYKRSKHIGLEQTGIVGANIGVVSGAFLVAKGGSLTHVCVSGSIFVLMAIAMLKIPRVYIARRQRDTA